MRAVLAAAAFAGTGVSFAAAATPENVEIPMGEGKMRAMLYRPEGKGPFPAVIGLHGCEGLYNQAGAVAVLYRDWADVLAKAGFAVLYPDSYGSRGLGTQCSVRNRTVRPEIERVSDANLARRWLQTQSFAKPEHLSLLGWSTGAISTLWAIRLRGPRDNTPDFRSAAALYPGCNRLANAAWGARVPTLILAGAADDRSAASVCQQMANAARGRSAIASVVVYPGAYHDFDHPNRPVQVRTGYAFTVDGSGRGHSGTNAAARNDALKRVPEWLKR